MPQASMRNEDGRTAAGAPASAKGRCSQMTQQDVVEQSNLYPEAPANVSTEVRLAQWLFIGIVIMNILVGTGLWTFGTVSSAKAAAADLQHRLTISEALVSPELVLDASKRSILQDNLDGIHRDLVVLEGDIPLGGRIGPTNSIYHALLMLGDLVSVGHHAIVMSDILGPSFQTFVGSISHPVAADATVPQGALTEDGLAQAVSELKKAQSAWRSAMVERESISPSDLHLLPIKNVDKYLNKLDEAVPDVNRAFAIGLTLVPKLDVLLGVHNREQWLLFNMDSDELRPTGGFLGNYGLIAIQHGTLTTRISLHDVYTLDCPNDTCPARNLPSDFGWFQAGAGHFGLRDSNLDPDLPHAAPLMEHMFQLDGGPKVDGVILITPALIAHILNVTGPLSIPQFHETITGQNLRDKLHYYHKNPQIAEQLGISATALGTSKFKVFDVLLSRALIAKFSELTQSQLVKLLSVFGDGLHTKDVQVFSNDAQVENILSELDISGEIKASPDSLFVVDTNDLGSYANADVRESYADHITLDTQLGAQHALTITYTYPTPSHSYQINPTYTDFVRVIVPTSATHRAIAGDCTPVGVQQRGYAVLGCRMLLPVGQQRKLTFKWYTPPASTAGTAPRSYELLIQRQAGAVLAASVTVAAPDGMFIESASTARVRDGEAGWAANPFTLDTKIGVTFTNG